MQTSINTRNQVYAFIKDSLPKKRLDIFNHIKEIEPCSTSQVSNHFSVPINEVSGRFTELKRLFLIEEFGTVLNERTNHQNTQYTTVKSQEERIDLINKRYVELTDFRNKLINDYNLKLSKITRAILNREIKKTYKEINNLKSLLDSF